MLICLKGIKYLKCALTVIQMTLCADVFPNNKLHVASMKCNLC